VSVLKRNDIGSYLVKKGKLDEAIEWLEKAETAPRMSYGTSRT
jgi:Tfp pilus assembly protein PilF